MNEKSKNSKNTILNVAMDEFAEHGYKQGSTNRITEKSGFSKGLIFHYFGNKRKLYLECVKKALDEYMEDLQYHIDLNEKDFFERAWKATMVINQKIGRKQYIYNMILADFYLLSEEDGFSDFKQIKDNHGNNAINLFYENIDLTIFRKDIPIEKIYNFIFTTINAFNTKCYNQSGKEKFKDYLDSTSKRHEEAKMYFNELIKEFEIIEMLIKNGVYKK